MPASSPVRGLHTCMCIARNISIVWLNTHQLSLCFLRMDSPRAPKPCQLNGCLGGVSLLHGTAQGISILCPCLNSPQSLLMCVGSCSIHLPCIFTLTHRAGTNRLQPGANFLLQTPRSSSTRHWLCCSSPPAGLESLSLKSQALHMVP